MRSPLEHSPPHRLYPARRGHSARGLAGHDSHLSGVDRRGAVWGAGDCLVVAGVLRAVLFDLGRATAQRITSAKQGLCRFPFCSFTSTVLDCDGSVNNQG